MPIGLRGTGHWAQGPVEDAGPSAHLHEVFFWFFFFWSETLTPVSCWSSGRAHHFPPCQSCRYQSCLLSWGPAVLSSSPGVTAHLLLDTLLGNTSKLAKWTVYSGLASMSDDWLLQKFQIWEICVINYTVTGNSFYPYTETFLTIQVVIVCIHPTCSYISWEVYVKLRRRLRCRVKMGFQLWRKLQRRSDADVSIKVAHKLSTKFLRLTKIKKVSCNTNEFTLKAAK